MTTAGGTPPRTGPAPGLRVTYRPHAGALEPDWPADRIAEALADEGGVVWVDVEDPGPDHAAVEALFRDVFRFHPLAIDDALHEQHVPKVDDWSQYLYLVFHSLDFDPDTDDLVLHELDMFLGPNYLVTYHTGPLALLDDQRRQLQRDNGERLKHGPDHLLYRIFDQGVDAYLAAIEHLDEAIDQAQDEVFRAATPATIQKIFQVKRSALRIHRTIAPQREVLNKLARDEYAQIDAKDRVYFRDVYDHLVRLHDITETLRDLISGALDTYLSALSNRTNEVMKALTVVSLVFLPLNLLAGFWGMNFFADTLAFKAPRLPGTLLFVLTLLGMLLSPVAVLALLKRRGWF